MSSNSTSEIAYASDRWTGIFLISLSAFGYVGNFLFFLSSLLYKQLQKDAAFILVLNLVLSDTGHLSIMLFHVEIEKINHLIEWPWW